MILSFHPIIEAHQNIICAGREPNGGDLAAIRQAQAVILPQGCTQALYRMARRNCPHIFPNLDIRFDYPGKCGQIRLFQSIGMNHPRSECYTSVAVLDTSPPTIAFPVVIKLDWGGQGETVYKIDDADALAAVLAQVKAYEGSGQKGFLVQEFIETRNRSLRVVVIGSRFFSYWRRQPELVAFGTSVTQGAVIDPLADPHLQTAAVDAARYLCRQTGLQLAGLDFIFDEADGGHHPDSPLILELNYYFGRSGLGGSERYYEILETEVDRWLATLSLTR